MGGREREGEREREEESEGGREREEESEGGREMERRGRAWEGGRERESGRERERAREAGRWRGEGGRERERGIQLSIIRPADSRHFFSLPRNIHGRAPIFSLSPRPSSMVEGGREMERRGRARDGG